MIVTLNGRPIEVVKQVEQKEQVLEQDFSKLILGSGLVTGLMIFQNVAHAAYSTEDIPEFFPQFSPLFLLIAEVVGVVGVFFIMGGIIVMLFQKRLGIKYIKVAAFAIIASCLVPSAVMFLILIGRLFNQTISAALAHMTH